MEKVKVISGAHAYQFKYKDRIRSYGWEYRYFPDSGVIEYGPGSGILARAATFEIAKEIISQDWIDRESEYLEFEKNR
jgi:hypothetical protein